MAMKKEAQVTYGLYMIACFDVLGQSSKLLEMARRSPESREEALDGLQQTAGVVLGVRDIFENSISIAAEPSEFSASLPLDMREFLHAHTRPELIRWGFSDTYVVAYPVMHRNGQEASSAVVAVLQTMYTASMLWLATLSVGHPLRGGIEIGLAVDIEPGKEVYGSALLEAHRLESRLAEYPRIVVGKGCIDFLRAAAEDGRQLTDTSYKAAASSAKSCLRMLREDNGQYAMLDSLGDEHLAIVKNVEGTREFFHNAQEQVRAQLDRASINKDSKLISRYERLLTYFNENASKWRRAEDSP